MNHYKICIYFLLILLFTKCNDAEQKEFNIQNKFTEFKEKVQVKTELKRLNRRVQAYKIFITDDILVVVQIWVDKGYYFKFFDKKTLKFIGETGKRGHAPNEIVAGVFPTIDVENKKVYICDQGRNRDIYEFDIEESIKDTAYIPKKLFEIGMKKRYVERFNYCGDGAFVYNYTRNIKDSAEYFFTFCNNKGEGISNFVEEPKTLGFPEEARCVIVRSHVFYKNNMLFLAQQNFDKILSFNITNKKVIFETNGPDLVEPEIEIHGTRWLPYENERMVAYRSIAASDKYVYALYSGEFETMKKHAPRGTKHIFVFDLQGKPIKQLELDRPVMKITYDDEKNELICIQNDERTGQNTLGLAYVKLDDYGL